MQARRLIMAAAALSAPIAGTAQAEEFKATKTEVRAWVTADANEDGALTPPEFPAFVDAMAASGQSTAQTVRFFGAYEIAFSVADKNGDGRVTPNELRDADDSYREEQGN